MSYWGALFCPACVAELVAELDDSGSWPEEWWTVEAPPHLCVLGAGGVWMGHERVAPLPGSLEALGTFVEARGIRQVWVHATAFVTLEFPPRISVPRTGGSVEHSWTSACGEWTTSGGPGLKAWGYWFVKGRGGFDLHIPAYDSESPWGECESPPHLLAHVAMFDRATKGCEWKGRGGATSDAWIRKTRGRVLQRKGPTVNPNPVVEREAVEHAMVWHRAPRDDERHLRYCHALDLNLAYATAASSLELPTGEPVHVDWPSAPYLPGVYLVECSGDGVHWVTAPTMQRMDGRCEALDEAWVWPEHGRHLRPWYEMVRDARAELLEAGGPALQAVKDIVRRGVGRLSSPQRAKGTEDPLFLPYWGWAIIAETRERLLERAAALPVQPVAIDTDCLYFLSSRATPSVLGAAIGLPIGNGLGQFKDAGTCTAAEARLGLAEERSSRAVAALREACHGGR